MCEIREERRTYVPRTFQLYHFMTILVYYDLTGSRLSSVLDNDEEKRASGYGERVPLGGGILPSFDESS